MNAATAKRVKALKINAKNEEEAREKLLEILVENGIEGMEEEETDTLLDIAESFVEDDNSGDDEEQTEEEENDELAEEVEEEEEEKPKKSAKKASKKVEEPEEEEEDDEETEEEEEDEDEGDEFAEMDRTALKAYIKDNELDITVKKSMTDDDIRDLIRAEVGEEEEEDEKPAPKSKASTKTAEKAAPKKAEKKETKPAAGKRGTKLDPKNNEDDRKAFAPLKKLFPESEYAYAWVASAGVTIKHKGKNSQRSMVLIENCSKQADGSIKCNLYLLTFTKQTEVLDKAGIDYEPCWSGTPLIKGITLDEAIEIITDLMEHITATVQKIDKKLGENRKKMEENLDKKKPAKKSTKVEEPEEEEDEDDEEEEEAPKKKASKAAPAKKAAKKVVEEEDEAPVEKKKAASKSAPAKKTTKKK